MSKNLRQQMPQTAAIIDRMRTNLGKDAVDAILRKAMRGEAGCFYAYENGQSFGTPNTSVTSVAAWDKIGNPIREAPAWVVQTRAQAKADGYVIREADTKDLDDMRREADQLRKYLRERRDD